MKVAEKVLALGMVCIATPAFSQSSVTIYGVIDAGINYVSNAQTASVTSPTGRTGASLVQMTTGVMQATRWGLRGTEELGGGYRTLFTLEDGFDVTTGRFQQGGTFFGRQAWVGLAAPWGKLTMGRQYDSVVDMIGPIQGSTGAGAIAIHPGDIDNVANSYRINNSVKFTSNTYGGLAFTALYGFGGIAGSMARDSAYSLGASYQNRGLVAGVAYLSVRNPNLSFWGNNASSSATGNNLGSLTGVQSNPIFAGFASAKIYQVVATAVQYDFGAVKAGIGYSNISFQDLNDAGSGSLALTNPKGYTGTASFNNYSAYFRYLVTPTLQLSGAYDYLTGGRVNNKSSAAYNQFNLALDYFLSKRTDVYVMGAYIKASGTDSTGGPAVPYTVTATAANSSNQAIVRLGIRHLF
ncbi:porin [Paraburkholderia aromaticivorans]|uniref:porin n=1 Tax=Paraburkholderia aromaticivorans TaxID=2026199 RepID=UPI001F1168D6|nr:porin [Paraburkholderia aromaticivorans]